MSAVVSWNLECAVREGQLDALRPLMAEMVASTKANEPGTLVYEWFLSADNTTCHLYERYADSAAALVHIGTFASQWAERMLACLEPTALRVWGEPSDEVRGALDGFGAAYFAPWDGFAR